MLRKTRVFVILFFLISVLVFGGYYIMHAVTTDRTVPVIEMNSDTVTVSVEGGDEAILEGITAIDEKDGDITNDLFIEYRSDFKDEKGCFDVTVAVADKDNHVAKAERTVIYSDYKSPQFKLSNPLKFQTIRDNLDDLNIASSLSATDMIDGNISNRIKISSDYFINESTVGDYPMEFIVTNSMGDTVKLPVTVTIYSAADETGLPEISLSDYLLNVPAGSSADINALIKQIKYHNEIYRIGDDGNFYNGEFDADGNPEMFDSSSITIDTDVDWNTPGVYEAKITITDSTTNLSNFTRCYIVIY